MNIVINLLIIVEIIVSILLILVILVQPSKSGGLGGALGGGMGEQLFGARTGNVLTKATIILASVFVLNTLLLTVLYSSGTDVRPPVSPSPSMNAPEEPGEGDVEPETPGAGEAEITPEEMEAVSGALQEAPAADIAPVPTEAPVVPEPIP